MSLIDNDTIQLEVECKFGGLHKFHSCSEYQKNVWRKMFPLLRTLPPFLFMENQGTKKGEIDYPYICLTTRKLNMDFQYFSTIFELLSCKRAKEGERVEYFSRICATRRN